MSIFNSLGSNYDFGFVIQSLFPKNKQNKELISFLEKKYQGQVTLLYKGRQAIKLGLESLNLPKDSEVAINSFTCKAVWEAIEKAGYGYEFLDLEKNTLNFSPSTLNQALIKNPKIKIAIIQNTLGYPCEIEKIEKICQEKNIILLEDLAHSIGTRYQDGREAGMVGDIVTLSFSQDKIVDGVSGGALIIRNKKYQNKTQNKFYTLDNKQQRIDKFYPLLTFKIRKTYDLGIGKILHFLLKNFNLLSKPMTSIFYDTYSLPNWYANLALLAFNDLAKNLKHKNLIANIYKNSLNKKVLWNYVTENIYFSSNLRFPIFVENRKNLVDYLKNYGIYISDTWYDKVIKDNRNSYETSQKILNLPTHINVSESTARHICERINQWLKLQ
jgi:dTDP-4-amino-4,6-dideoxygalactose transaminase